MARSRAPPARRAAITVAEPEAAAPDLSRSAYASDVTRSTSAER
jgi:hypothetical protein